MNAGILNVDAAAGLRLVSEKQVAGEWQVPAELVRLALARGAAEVRVKLNAARFEFFARGASLPVRQLELLVDTLNPTDDVRRMTALEGLENQDCVALLWGARLAQRSFHLETTAPGGSGAAVHFACSEAKLTATTHVDGLRCVVEKPATDVKRALRWLAKACRFARRPVFVNGADVRGAPASGCFRAECEHPLPMIVVLGVPFDSPKIWLLRHGVVQGRATIPRWPAFEAGVELAGEVQGWASAEDLRRKLAPHLPVLIDRAVSLMIRVVPQLETLNSVRRERLRLPLMCAVQRGVLAEDVCDAELFELVESGDNAWVSINSIRTIQERGPLVVAENVEQAGHLRPVLLANPAEQIALREILDRDLLRCGDMIQGRLRRVWSRLSSFFRDWPKRIRSRPVDRNDLTTQELGLVLGLEKCLRVEDRPVVVVLDEGVKTADLRDQRILLPRDDELVRHCIRLLDKEKRWLVPVALALAGDVATVDSSLQREWARGK